MGIASEFTLQRFSAGLPPEGLCCTEVVVFIDVAAGVSISQRPQGTIVTGFDFFMFEPLPPFKQGRSLYSEQLNYPVLTGRRF